MAKRPFVGTTFRRKRRSQFSRAADLSSYQYTPGAPAVTTYTPSTTVTNITVVAASAAEAQLIRWIEIDFMALTVTSAEFSLLEIALMRTSEATPASVFDEDRIVEAKMGQKLYLYDVKPFGFNTSAAHFEPKWRIKLRKIVLSPDEKLVIQFRHSVGGSASSGRYFADWRYGVIATG